MEIVTSWMEDGLKQGLQQGLQQGQQQGQQQGIQQGRRVGMETLLLRQMQSRLGVLSEQTEMRVRRLSEDQLAELGEAVFDFVTLADLDNWLNQKNV